MDSGWKVRVVDSLPGTFHPKLYVGAASFDDATGVSDLSLAIVGSPNLSRGGFISNGECTFWSSAPHSRDSAARAWLGCWTLGSPLTSTKLSDYEKYFALRNRNRQPSDLVTLGIADGMPTAENGKPKKNISPPKKEEKAISETAASVTWAGLQSFTGEYNLQLEFPKEAGLVLKRLIGRPSTDGIVDMICADQQNRSFRYRYYEHNGMFRLNIPNATPLVDWVRENKDGIACVVFDETTNNLRFDIVLPGQVMLDVIDRSLAFGTWGRTSTRLYGWY